MEYSSVPMHLSKVYKLYKNDLSDGIFLLLCVICVVVLHILGKAGIFLNGAGRAKLGGGRGGGAGRVRGERSSEGRRVEGEGRLERVGPGQGVKEERGLEEQYRDSLLPFVLDDCNS